VHYSFEKGETIFIPQNSWHGFANHDHELLLLWVVIRQSFSKIFFISLVSALATSRSEETPFIVINALEFIDPVAVN